MPRLEVIVTSACEAAMAEAGGADRLELVRDLDSGGLTPGWDTVNEVLQAVSIPVRVMLRGNASMSIAGADELSALVETAERFRKLPIDGLVVGWITSWGETDTAALTAVSAAAPTAITFHRAFEHLKDPLASVGILKGFPQIDRILTCGGAGTWSERKRRLGEWSVAAAPEIGIMVGGGLSSDEVAELMADRQFAEVHVGRAARTPEENRGVIDPAKIARMKNHAAQ